MTKKKLTEEEKKEVKRLRTKSIAFLCSYYFFVAAVPIFIISVYFDLFNKVGKYKPSGILLIALIMIAIFFKNQLKRFITTLEAGPFKTFVTSCYIPILLCFLLLIVWWASSSIQQLKMVLFFSMLSNIVAIPFNVKFTMINEKIKEITGEDEKSEQIEKSEKQN